MVRVEPITRAWAEALALGDEVFTDRFGVAVEADWAGFPEVVPFLLVSAGGPWGPHLFFDGDGALVGNGGWKGEPVGRAPGAQCGGAAELGYSVAPSRQGRGIATAAVRVLLERARAAGLCTAVAHTLPHVSPSTSVLTRCGFTQVGEAVDPDLHTTAGPVWRWELAL